jgi:hypothetical protein
MHQQPIGEAILKCSLRGGQLVVNDVAEKLFLTINTNYNNIKAKSAVIYPNFPGYAK